MISTQETDWQRIAEYLAIRLSAKERYSMSATRDASDWLDLASIAVRRLTNAHGKEWKQWAELEALR